MSNLNKSIPLLEQYRDLVELHKGQHSTVWSCRDVAKGSVVVIKSYSKEKMRPRHVRSVIREKRILQAFNESRCRGVVKLLKAFEDDLNVYLVFEACMKGDLYQLMSKTNGAMNEQFVACQVITPLLYTLQLLHSLNIVHRDIKTENVFMSVTGELQLGDFGLAAHKLHDVLTDRVGTLDYMSPEVLSMPAPSDSMRGGNHSTPPAQHLKPYNEKVDVWALGVLLHELLVGKTPFEVEDPQETAARILGSDLPPLPSGIPADCADFISKALTKDAELRPSAADLCSHPWLQRHLRLLAPNARPRGHMMDAFDVAQMKQTIYDAWNLEELERALSLFSLPSADSDSTGLERGEGSDLATTSSVIQAALSQQLSDSLQPSAPAVQQMGDPISADGSLNSVSLSTPLDKSELGSGDSGLPSPSMSPSPSFSRTAPDISVFRSNHSYNILCKERVPCTEWSSKSYVSGQSDGRMRSSLQLPSKSLVIDTDPIRKSTSGLHSAPPLTISAFTPASHTAPTSPTSSNGSDGSQAWDAADVQQHQESTACDLGAAWKQGGVSVKKVAATRSRFAK